MSTMEHNETTEALLARLNQIQDQAALKPNQTSLDSLTREYRIQAARYERILTRFFGSLIEIFDLEKSFKFLRPLRDASNELRILPETCVHPLLIPVSELMEAYHEMEVELVRDERVHAELDRQRDAMEKLVGDLQASLDRADRLKPVIQQKTRDWQQNSRVLLKKQQEYQQRLELYQELDERLNGDLKPIRYAELLQKKKQIQQCLEQIQETQKELDIYKELPADLTLAKFRVEEKMAEYRQLDAKRREILGSIASTL